MNINYERLKALSDLLLAAWNHVRPRVLEMLVQQVRVLTFQTPHKRIDYFMQYGSVGEALANNQSVRYLQDAFDNVLTAWTSPFHQYSQGNMRPLLEHLPLQIAHVAFRGSYKISSLGFNFIRRLLYWSAARPDIIKTLSANCFVLKDKVIERVNSMICRSMPTNVRVTFKHIEHASNIVQSKHSLYDDLRSHCGHSKPVVSRTTKFLCDRLAGVSFAPTVERIEAWILRRFEEAVTNPARLVFVDRRPSVSAAFVHARKYSDKRLSSVCM